MSKNILICLKKLDIGGIETSVVNQVTEMLERGYGVVILSKRGIYTEKMVSKGAICIDFDYELTDGYDLKRAEIIEKIINEYNISQIHIHQFDCITSCFPAALNTNTPYVAFVHTGIMGTYDWFEDHFISYKTIYNLYFNMACKIVAITENAKNENKSKYNVDESKYIIVNNSINFEKKLIENNNIPEKIENFLIVSRLASEKVESIKNAINVFKMYYKTHSKSHLTIVGEGEKKEEILNEMNDIKDSISFLGARDDVIDIMLKNDVVIALDRCILEAVASKRIAVISGYENLRGIVTSENIAKAASDNFSGNNLKEVTIDNIVNELSQLTKDDIKNIVHSNYEFAFNKLNSKKNIYVNEDCLGNLNIDKKIFFENEQTLIEKIKKCEEQKEKIYSNSKEAQEYFMGQIKNRENEINALKHEIDDLKHGLDELKLLNKNYEQKINVEYSDYYEIKEKLDKITNSKIWKFFYN